MDITVAEQIVQFPLGSVYCLHIVMTQKKSVPLECPFKGRASIQQESHICVCVLL